MIEVFMSFFSFLVHPLNLFPFQTIYDIDVDYFDENRKSFIPGHFHDVYHKHGQF